MKQINLFGKKYATLNKTKEAESKKEAVKDAALEMLTCPSCGKELFKQRVVKGKYVCYECGYYFRVRAKTVLKW